MRLLKNLLLRVFEKKAPEATEHELLLEKRVKSLANDNRDDWLSGLTGTETWKQFNSDLIDFFLVEKLRDFLQWPVIRKSMFVSNAKYVAEELASLKSRQDWEKNWKPAIEESWVGRPRPYPKYYRSSGNLIHHAYLVSQFESFANIELDDVGLIFEFGGGYGSMARLFRQLNYKGKYVIFDFPIFGLLQYYYLSLLGYEVDIWTEQYGGADNVCVSNIDDLSLLINSTGSRKRFFIATWSISESPVSLRDKVLPMISGWDYVFIAFQDSFEDIDNVEYFSEFICRRREMKWRLISMPHLPGNSMLMGYKVMEK